MEAVPEDMEATQAADLSQQPGSSPKRRRLSSRSVAFAPAPEEVASKYETQDGHPPHEGQVARQQRRAPGGLSFPSELTPSAVRALEAELGEECRPSLDRLKRRVGLLPLRRRPRMYIPGEGDAAEAEAEPPLEPGAPRSGVPRPPSAGSAGAEGASSSAPQQQQQQQQQKGGGRKPAKRLGSLRDPVTAGRGAPRHLGRLPALGASLRAGSGPP